VRTASFFSPIDWKVAERLGLPPALPPSTDVIYSGSVGSSFDTEESAEVLSTYLAGCEADEEPSSPYRGANRVSKGRDPVSTEHLFSLGLTRVSKSPLIASANDNDGFNWDDDDEDMYRRRASSVTGGDSWPAPKN
jgi:hypothetical protein